MIRCLLQARRAESHASSCSRLRQLAVGNEPITPWPQAATTRSTPETRNIGAAISGRLKRSATRDRRSVGFDMGIPASGAAAIPRIASVVIASSGNIGAIVGHAFLPIILSPAVASAPRNSAGSRLRGRCEGGCRRWRGVSRAQAAVISALAEIIAATGWLRRGPRASRPRAGSISPSTTTLLLSISNGAQKPRAAIDDATSRVDHLSDQGQRLLQLGLGIRAHSVGEDGAYLPRARNRPALCRCDHPSL